MNKPRGESRSSLGAAGASVLHGERKPAMEALCRGRSLNSFFRNQYEAI